MQPLTTVCPKCGHNRFEARQERIEGKDFGVIRCGSCKSMLGVKDVADALKAFDTIYEDILKIKKHLKID